MCRQAQDTVRLLLRLLRFQFPCVSYNLGSRFCSKPSLRLLRRLQQSHVLLSLKHMPRTPRQGLDKDKKPETAWHRNKDWQQQALELMMMLAMMVMIMITIAIDGSMSPETGPRGLEQGAMVPQTLVYALAGSVPMRYFPDNPQDKTWIWITRKAETLKCTLLLKF